jgi:hypothetical protein
MLEETVRIICCLSCCSTIMNCTMDGRNEKAPDFFSLKSYVDAVRIDILWVVVRCVATGSARPQILHALFTAAVGLLILN